jgi:uncharacterized protein YhfF
MESAVLEFWRSYVDALPLDRDRQRKAAGVFSFGDSKEMADELATLARQGIKTVTCSPLLSYEIDQTPLPQKRDLSVVLDGSGNPVLVIETVEVFLVPFSEVSEHPRVSVNTGNDEILGCLFNRLALRMNALYLGNKRVIGAFLASLKYRSQF